MTRPNGIMWTVSVFVGCDEKLLLRRGNQPVLLDVANENDSTMPFLRFEIIFQTRVCFALIIIIYPNSHFTLSYSGGRLPKIVFCSFSPDLKWKTTEEPMTYHLNALITIYIILCMCSCCKVHHSIRVHLFKIILFLPPLRTAGVYLAWKVPEWLISYTLGLCSAPVYNKS